ncbi:hypothetical protein FMEAI12_6070024 [Parafrankia sp. Ea1.12]|nr:hypothetical protein FMEAI12_6070024 [Parafrankia sp. Ea1.12]
MAVAVAVAVAEVGAVVVVGGVVVNAVLGVVLTLLQVLLPGSGVRAGLARVPALEPVPAAAALVRSRFGELGLRPVLVRVGDLALARACARP